MEQKPKSSVASSSSVRAPSAELLRKAVTVWNEALSTCESALQEGDYAKCEEAEEYLQHLASVFLLGHGKGDLEMPRDVALWLHRVLEDAGRGFPIPSVRRFAGGRNKSELTAFAEAFAVAYVHAAEADRIDDPDPKRSVKAAFKITVDRTYHRWLEKRQPTPAFDMCLEERRPELRTSWAKRFLAYHGANHRRLTQKRR